MKGAQTAGEAHADISTSQSARHVSIAHVRRGPQSSAVLHGSPSARPPSDAQDVACTLPDAKAVAANT